MSTMGEGFQLHAHKDLAEASDALAGWVASAIIQQLKQQERASIALPGGSTPGLFLTALSRQALPWKRITLLPTDERFVPADHPRSNERMMRAALAPALAAGADWLSFASDEPPFATDSLAARLDAAVASLLPLSVVVCGMGEDGHVASLFPGEKAAEVVDPMGPAVVAAFPAGLEARLSLSASALASATEAALLFSGPAKSRVFAQAMRFRDKPVAVLLSAHRRLHVFMAE